MTISSAIRKAGPYVGNGVATSFVFAFKVFARSDVTVTLLTTATGVETTLTLDIDYSVALNADQNTNPGGTVTYNPGGTPMASTHTLTLTSDVPQTQGTDIQNAGGFYPQVIEDALDRAVALIQQLGEIVGRTFRLPVSSTADPTLPMPTGAPGGFGWNAAGTAIVNYVFQAGTSLVDLAASGGSALIGFVQSGTGAVLRTLQAKAREYVSTLDFGALQDGTAQQVNAQKAIDSMWRSSDGVYFGAVNLPDGYTCIDNTLKVRPDSRGFTLQGKGSTASILKNISPDPRDALWCAYRFKLSIGLHATNDHGTGYAVNDTLTISGGTAVVTAVARVATIGGGGEVTSITTVEGGEYEVIPASPAVTTTNGAGTGCKLLVSEVANYNTMLRDFKVQATSANATGIKYINSHQGAIENVKVEFTGGHGFEIENSFQNYFENLHARRCGWLAGAPVAGKAGFNLKGNTGFVMRHILASENGIGVRVDGGGAVFDGLDTEGNLAGGIVTVGGGNITVTHGYQENQGGDDAWYIGDGTSGYGPAIFSKCVMGAQGKFVFNGVDHYIIDKTNFSYPYGNIEITTPATTKGRITNPWFGSLTSQANKYATYNHIPDASRSGNLIRNGSFEVGSTLFGLPGWAVSEHLTVPSTYAYSAGLGHDRGTKALTWTINTAGSAAPDIAIGTILTPNKLPYLKAGYVYTFGITYTASAASQLKLNLYTGSGGTLVKHVNGWELAAAATPTRYYVTFVAQETGPMNTLNLTLNATGEVTIDSITLNEGVEPKDPEFSVDESCLEHETFRALTTPVTDAIHANLTDYGALVTTGITQPDVARTLTFTGSGAGVDAGVMQVYGLDSKGKELIEAVTIAAGVGPSASSNAFLIVTGFSGYAAGGGDFVSVGTGLGIGLSKTAMSIVKVNQNGAHTVAWTFDVDTNTLHMTAISAGDDIQVWYKA